MAVSNPYRYSTNFATISFIRAYDDVSNPYRYSTNQVHSVRTDEVGGVSNPYRYSTNDDFIYKYVPSENSFKPL